MGPVCKEFNLATGLFFYASTRAFNRMAAATGISANVARDPASTRLLRESANATDQRSSPKFRSRPRRARGDRGDHGERAIAAAGIARRLQAWRVVASLLPDRSQGRSIAGRGARKRGSQNIRAYRSGHGAYLRRRREWFEAPTKPHMVCWWIPAGEVPTVADATRRLELLRVSGPTADGFLFTDPLPAPDGILKS